MLSATFSALNDLYDKCLARSGEERALEPDEIFSLEHELMDIVETVASTFSSEHLQAESRIVMQVQAVWAVTVQLIRRRIFNNDLSGAMLIRVNEIDFMYVDAICSLRLGACLPVIDFELTADVG